MSRCSKIFTVFSQPGWFNLRGYFKVCYWCFRDINACMKMSFPWCLNIIFGKRNHTLHPASVINVIPHLEFCAWTKLCPVNWFHSSKFGAKITMKTFQCFILPHQQLNSYSVLSNTSTRVCPQAKSPTIKVRQNLDAFWGFINGMQTCHTQAKQRDAHHPFVPMQPRIIYLNQQ